MKNLKLLEYMPEQFVSVLGESDSYHEFWNKVTDIVIGDTEYLESQIPIRQIGSSYCLSGRPSVRSFMGEVCGSNQERLIEFPYQYKLIELSPINFSMNIHIKIFEGFCHALNLNQEPLKSLLEEVVSQNSDAWNHPFRIGWLVYFICEEYQLNRLVRAFRHHYLKDA